MVKPPPGRGMEKESLRMSPFSRKEFRMTHTKGYRVVSDHTPSTTMSMAMAEP